MDIPTRFEEIRDRMERAMELAGREPSSVKLVAVTKTRSVEEMATAVEAGVTDVGENKVQEVAWRGDVDGDPCGVGRSKYCCAPQAEVLFTLGYLLA